MMTRYGLLLAIVVSLFLCSACGRWFGHPHMPDSCEVGNRIAADKSCKWESNGVSLEARVTSDLLLDVTVRDEMTFFGTCEHSESFYPASSNVREYGPPWCPGEKKGNGEMVKYCCVDRKQDGTITVYSRTVYSSVGIKYQNGGWVVRQQ